MNGRSVVLDGIVEIDAVSPLLNEIARFADLSWDVPGQGAHAWFAGTLYRKTAVVPAA